jgi:hypothetical protein
MEYLLDRSEQYHGKPFKKALVRLITALPMPRLFLILATLGLHASLNPAEHVSPSSSSSSSPLPPPTPPGLEEFLAQLSSAGGAGLLDPATVRSGWSPQGAELSLGGKAVGDTGAVALARVLGKSASLPLVKLGLASNQIGAAGAAALAQALEKNSALRELNLMGNEIGDLGATALAQGLASNTGLRDLYLSGNKITDAGAVALAEGLAKNTGLEELYLHYNDIDDDGGEALARAMTRNRVVKVSGVFRGIPRWEKLRERVEKEGGARGRPDL